MRDERRRSTEFKFQSGRILYTEYSVYELHHNCATILFMTLATLNTTRKGFIKPGGLCEPMKWTWNYVNPTYYFSNTDIGNKAMRLKVELHCVFVQCLPNSRTEKYGINTVPYQFMIRD
jgi:hypothetical protein